LPQLSKFLALSGSERRLLLTAAFLLPILAAAVRSLGLMRVQRHLGRSPEARRGSDVAAPALATLVNVAANHLPIACGCLTRSLLLDWMLRRRGYASQLRIGVRLLDAHLQAHAWVELNGQPLNDPPGVAERFAAFEGPPYPRLRAGT
jgi:hypothetical protein